MPTPWGQQTPYKITANNPSPINHHHEPARRTRNGNAGCYDFNDKVTTTFLLKQDMKQYPCPSFKGKEEDKQKVYRALRKEMDPEVRANWAYLKCYCGQVPKIRLSKTARNLNKAFLTCGGPYTRCKYFQWIHTPLYPLPSDPVPEWFEKPAKPRKFVNKQTQTEWFEQAQEM